MQLESALLLGVCVFLGFILPLLLRSRFDGVWFRTGGDLNAPAERKVLAQHGKLSQVLPIGCLSGDTYETITLIADGREHPWEEPPGCTVKPATASYSAQLTGSSFELVRRTPGGTFRESWQVTGPGRMVIWADGQRAIYERASWLRSLFTEEP
jgi:hypothetical protein